MRTLVLKGLLLAATSLSATGALAQTADQSGDAPAPAADTPQAEASDDDNDIVVTAQRREQSLQDVPIAITAVSGESLQRSGITSTDQIASLAPGLTMTQQRQTVQPYLRGVGTQNTAPGDEGTVALYIDNVYRVDGAVSLAALNNIERVEILRGPQGTLFGRNAVGGLIHILTRDPQHELELNVSASYESFDALMGSVYANLPIGDNAAINFSGYLRNQGDGWGTNFFNGRDVNFRDEISLRPKLRIWIGSNTTAQFTLDYSRVDTDYGNTKNVFPGRRSAVGLGSQVGTIYDADTAVVQTEDNYLRSIVGSARIVHNTGWGSISSTTAYSSTRSPVWTDADGSRIVAADAFSPYESDAFQQEFVLSGTVGIVDFTTGVYYLHSKARFDPLQIFSVLAPAANTAVFSEVTSEAYAGFLQGDIRITPQATLTLGARYTHDNRVIVAQRVATAGNALPIGTVIQDTATLPVSQTDRNWDKITYRAAFTYEFTPDVLAYASFSTGYKSGVFSAASPFSPAVNPESLDAFEIGFKTDLFDRTIRFNVSVFHYDYSNVQLTQIIPLGSQLLNAAEVNSDGVEVELAWTPRLARGRLRLATVFSFNDAEYVSFPGAPRLDPRPAPAGGNVQTTIDASGNDVIKTPHFSATIQGDYSHPIGNGSLDINLTYSHTGSFYWDPDNVLRRPPLDIVNAQVTWRLNGDRGWRFSVYARNLFDEQYFQSVLSSASVSASTPGAPRVIGATIGWTY